MADAVVCVFSIGHNGEGLTYLAHHRHKNNERTWNTSRISRTKNMASYGKPVLAAAFLMFSGHSALGGASPTPRASHASFRLAGIGMLRCTRRRGANGHGLQAMAFRKTPDTRAVRLTTSRTACTRFFQVAANGQALPKAVHSTACGNAVLGAVFFSSGLWAIK